MKVDIEGAEQALFNGARGLFRRGAVRLGMFERLRRTDLDSLLSFFRETRDVVFCLTEQATICREEDELRKPLRNLFACPELVFRTLHPSSCRG